MERFGVLAVCTLYTIIHLSIRKQQYPWLDIGYIPSVATYVLVPRSRARRYANPYPGVQHLSYTQYPAGGEAIARAENTNRAARSNDGRLWALRCYGMYKVTQQHTGRP